MRRRRRKGRRGRGMMKIDGREWRSILYDWEELVHSVVCCGSLERGVGTV